MDNPESIVEKHGLIILKVQKYISKEDMKSLYGQILEQAKSGCIVLPKYVEAQYIPPDVDIKIEE